MKLKDIRGLEIKVDDRIAYGKSDRDHPIKLGVVKKIDEYGVTVLGDGNKRVGILDSWEGSSKRILVLPKDY